MSEYKHYQTVRTVKKVSRVFILLVLMVLIVAATGALAYVAGRMLTGKPLFDDMLIQYSIINNLAGENLSTSEQSEADAQTLPEDGATSIWNIGTPVAQTLSYETVGVDDRMLALPQNGRVSNDYFTTAMFVGDSLSQGFNDYASNLGITPIPAAFRGATPKALVENSTANLDQGENTDLAMWDYISAQTPANIYVGMGMNALVASDDDAAFLHYYGAMLDALRTQFPGIPVYVMSITPVTQEAEDERPSLSNSRIDLLNDALAVMAADRGMYYLDIQEVLEDENGLLRDDLKGYDGLHLESAEGYRIWLDYLATHTAYSPYNTQFLLEPYGS